MQIKTFDTYRSDIDGLRAFAVLAVIAFHASSRLVPGGFVGVDIFFVISGYLITGLIAKGIENNTFSFADFYTRRIKRIFPAYIAVALVTLLISSWLLIPNDYIFYTTSLAASWAFAANIFFSMLSWGYFGSRTEEFPLLHTWSLSVEEQFYFIFPFLLILLYRYARKQIIPALVVLGLIFLAISELRIGEVKSYFLLTARAHELIIGALAFFLSQITKTPGRLVSSALAATGLALMVGSLFLIDQGTAYPGIHSLYPCIGAALLIFAGRMENPVSSVLKNKLMVAIGLISYSLYLWHWPIFSFLRYRRIEINFAVGMAAVTLAFVLATLTWKFIEMPIRYNRKIRFRRAFVQIYMLPAAAFLAVGLYSYVTEGAPARFSGEMRELISSYSFERDLGRTCSIRPDDYRKIDAAYLESHCAFGDMSQQKPQVLLIGDSHGNHFKPFVDALLKDAHLKGVYHVQGDCAPTLLSRPGDQKEATTCQKRNADLLAIAANYKYVVLGGYWYELSLPNFASGLENVVERIHTAGAIPIVFKDNAFFEPDLSQCVLHRKRGWLPKDQNCNIPYTFVAKTQGPFDRIIDQIQVADSYVIVVDPKRIMCTSKECVTYIGNMALYKDSNHINTKAAQLLGQQYASKVENPFGRFQRAHIAASGL